MTLLNHIRFETTAPATEADPLRMDIPLFVGHLTAKGPVSAGSDLAAMWERQGYLTPEEKAGAEISLYDRPLRLKSPGDLLRYFDDSRADQRAVITGKVPRGPLDGTGFSVVVDGALRTMRLNSDDPAAVAAEIGLAWPDLQVIFTDRLTLSLPDAHGAGTLAVTEHPGLGFDTPKFTAARATGHITAAALRQFFAMGGQEAFVVSMGPALPVFAALDERTLALGAQIAASGLVADDPEPALRQGMPSAHAERATLTGISHLLGLEDASFLVMPELADLTSTARLQPEASPEGPDAPVEFAECLPEPVKPDENHLRTLALPRLDDVGVSLWEGAVTRCLNLIKSDRRDVVMVASCPVLSPGTKGPDGPQSAFLQLGAPFVKTPHSADLPGGVMGSDAVLVGQIAARLLSETPYQSAALGITPMVRDVVSGRMASLPVCRISMTRTIARLASDITTSDNPAWQSGTASRLAARLLRMARVYGETLVFDPISDTLMRRVQQRFETMLQSIADAGGLQAGDNDPGYTVICDRSIILQADIDQGRLRAEVSFRPSNPVDMIRVILPIGSGNGSRA